MKKILARNIFLAGLLALAAFSARADEEQDQFAVLHSNANISQKWKAFQKLRVIGTEKAVPEVAAFLADPELSQAARQTLDGLPYPEVDDVLRDALGKTTGLTKAGIIDTMGWREKSVSVPLLAPLLTDADTNIAAAAATSLGRIGGADAASALSAARDHASGPVQTALLAGLLHCAERLTDGGDQAGAAAIYRQVSDDKYPVGMRTAAWRGLVLSDSAHQTDLMKKALDGSDKALEKVAVKVLRESNNPQLIQACTGQWDSLPADAQLAVLDVTVKQGNAQSLIHTASQSPNPSVRMAAWKAMAELNDLTSIPTLAQAAAASQGNERQAARDSLGQLHGEGASAALMAELDHANPAEKAELLRAFGAWHDASGTKTLLDYARNGDQNQREAALQSLTEIAPSDALTPLLEISQTDALSDSSEQCMEALNAICQASPDKDAATKMVVEAEGKLTGDKQGLFLPLLAQLGTSDGLTVVETAGRSENIDLAKKAVRALGQWPNSSPAEFLLDCAGSAKNNALKILALRGAIATAGFEPSLDKRTEMLKKAMAAATRADEKRAALSQFSQIPSADALQACLQAMSDEAVSDEAALAALSVAEKINSSNPSAAKDAAVKILAQHKTGELFQRAWSIEFTPGRAGIPFVRDWVVCGPFSKKGVTGAMAIFNVPLGPELHGHAVKWKAMPADDHARLAAKFPGSENCAAYLRTTIIAPEDCSAVLLTGSDDGIKAWVNGAVVLGNNVDRPDVVDQDATPISLKKGENELVCKITQGGGGWSACARIVGTDGNPISGLKTERPKGAAGQLKGAE